MPEIITKLEGWTLRSESSKYNKQPVVALQSTVPSHEPLPAPKGGLVHETLIRESVIEDPLIGENCFQYEWIEQHDWIYEISFDMPAAKEGSRTELWFESLDGVALIYLNGQLIAQHSNSYRPLRVDVSAEAKPECNHLQIRLNLGLDAYTIKESTEPDGVCFATEESLGYRNHRGESRRIFLRKPAYGFGWDWSPRVATLGIAGDVILRTSQTARIESLSTATLLVDDDKANAQVQINVELNGLHDYSSSEAFLNVELVSPTGETVEMETRRILVSSGFSEEEFKITVQNPELWWPNGHGEQPLYSVHAQLKDNSQYELSSMSREMGIRSLRLLNADTFTFEVNGQKIFCQGGNWVPPDAIYTRASDERYLSLIQSAAAANMNMLRIWGGGRYESDFFYQTCDRMGLLVWQDFMFACAPYPDHLDWFRQEVTEEARYQVRRLSSHACLALWCGSNENTWAMCDWWDNQTRRGARLYNDILPRAVRELAPQVPYWVGSPYGGTTPNQTGCGNNHFWKEPGGTLCPEPSLRTDLSGHDRFHSFFISEYGYHGPCSLKETQRYLGAKNFDRNSSNWIHHTNTRSYESNLQAAVKQVYEVTLSEASNEDYLLYGGLWQGIAYAYSLDSAHFRNECSGALIWMLNEAWGEAGWGIIDNGLDRKISWYFIRRALAPERLILRRNKATDTVELMLYSATGNALSFQAELRLNSPDGSYQVLTQTEGKISDHREIISQAPTEALLETGSFISAHGQINNHTLDSVLLWPDNYSSILSDLKPQQIKAQVLDHPGKGISLNLEVDRFIHAVHLTQDDQTLLDCDQYFDMLPGDDKTINLNLSTSEATQLNIRWIGKDSQIYCQCLCDLIELSRV